MRCIISENTDPCFNLASEEVLLRSRNEDYFLLYRNRPSIVVGKHQNTLAEINLPYVEEKGIIVARRISGGGTVFHDLGNVNFAFITSGKEGELVDYKRHTNPIITAMKKMGLDVSLGKRNELLLGGRRFRGQPVMFLKRGSCIMAPCFFPLKWMIFHGPLKLSLGNLRIGLSNRYAPK